MAIKTNLKRNKKGQVVLSSTTKYAVDFGCGNNKHTQEHIKNVNLGDVDFVIGVDFVETEHSNIVHNLTQFPYPFENESVDVIVTSHFIEHLDGFERAKFFDECYRILKPNGKMRHTFPYANSNRATQDFTHKFPPINENSFAYFNKEWREANKLTHGYYDLISNFSANVLYLFQDGTLQNKTSEVQQREIMFNINKISDLIVDMVKI